MTPVSKKPVRSLSVDDLGLTPPVEYRVDCKAFGEKTWANNALTFSTEAEAEAYARNLHARWTMLETWRVVPTTTPEREPIDQAILDR